MKILFQITKYIGVLSIFYMFLTSCEEMMGNYLDKPPGVDVTEDTIFSTQINAEKFLMEIYRWGMYWDHPMWNERDGMRDAHYACFCDEAENLASWYRGNRYNENVTNTGFNEDGDIIWQKGQTRWEARWRAVRDISIFLDRIEDVPASQDYKDQAIGQALFIRGLLYFEMFKRYGGVPIVDSRFNIADPESMKIPRATVEEMINFIINDADKAASLLPDKWPPEYLGKITKGACLMLKARALLYAASPLSNTATPPLSLQGDDNLLICYGNTDVNRWKLAADAAKAVIDWAPGAGIKILTGSVSPRTGLDRSYQDVWEVPNNCEIILPVTLNWGTGNRNTMPFQSLTNFYNQQSGSQVTQNFVQKYEKRDGMPQVWDPNGGHNLNQMYAELDPRFEQSIGYNGSYWNIDLPKLDMWVGAPVGRPQTGAPVFNNKTSYWIRKMVPEALNSVNNSFPLYWNLYRLAEAYLNYAEALNEYNSSPPTEAYAAVKVIRDRAGMPEFPAGMTQAQFREKLRNERAIELAFEEHRLWDIVRWVIGEQEGVMRGNFWGIRIYKQDDPSTEFSWVPVVFEERFWTPNMYRIPFYQIEVDKGYITQNPGW